MAAKPLYRNARWKARLLDLYHRKLRSLELDCSETWVATASGRTHVLIAGEEGLPPAVLIHGITASAPIALEPIRNLSRRFRIYAVNCVGAPNPSAETRLPMFDDSYGKWLTEVLDGLGLQNPPFIAASYGAFVLQRLIAYNPGRVGAALFVVPAGFANAGPWTHITRVFLPLLAYLVTRRDRDLVRFMGGFFTEVDDFSVELQKAALNGIHMDYRKPPALEEREAAAFEGPVYFMAAGDDIFFPAAPGIARCRRLFKGFREAVILECSRHVPAPADFPRIEQQVGDWLQAVREAAPSQGRKAARPQ